MEQNKFFRIVWRFNALLLALGGILIVVMVGWNLFSPSWSELTPEGHFAPVPKEAERADTYRITPLQIALAQESIFALGRWNGPPKEYGLQDTVRRPFAVSSLDNHNAVNLLAIDGQNGTSHWLFDGYRRAVISEDAITKATSDKGVSNQIGLVVRTADTDTNADGQLTDKDRQSLYFYRPGMRSAAKFFEADYIISRGQSDDANYLVVYERGRSAIAATFTLPDFKLKSENPIPAVSN